MSVNVSASNVSTAWLAAMDSLSREPGLKAIHTVVRIADPTAETPAVRRSVDELLLAKGHQSVETVANTIFPNAIARTSRDHADLVNRYSAMYPHLRKFPANRRGTYFGRLIQYPVGAKVVDQIGAIISRIRGQRDTGKPLRAARYEALLDVPNDLVVDAPVYVPGKDNNPMAFPCLSYCSFQLEPTDGRKLHLLAMYRSQYLVQRGYGNYLGLGRLLAYVATQAGLQVGTLTVVAGLAHLEELVVQVRRLLDRFSREPAAS
jgi:hypothetical protein